MVNQHFEKAENTGFRHLVNATRFSLKGLKSALMLESAFRQELLFLTILLVSGGYCARSLLAMVVLVCVSLLVLVIELLNSAVEAAIDRIGPEFHELSGRAKDYGSAAVMLSLVMVSTVWAYIVIGRIFGVS
jgi:diacylglycerol kinase (ATP)